MTIIVMSKIMNSDNDSIDECKMSDNLQLMVKKNITPPTFNVDVRNFKHLTGLNIDNTMPIY